MVNDEYFWPEEVSVGEIAKRSGFQTSYHFSRRVRQATGLSPLEVRQQAWQCR